MKSSTVDDFFFRLKEFETIIDFNTFFQLGAFLEFVQNQTNLEELRLAFWNLVPDEAKVLLFHILIHVPKLKCLCLYFIGGGFSSTNAELSTFLTNISHLETLTLELSPSIERSNPECPALTFDSQESFNEPSLQTTKYVALKNLQLTRVDEKICFQILMRCSTCLRSLRLRPPSIDHEMVQKIIGTLTELETLQILGEDLEPLISTIPFERDNASSNDVMHSPRRLLNLLHLEIGRLSHNLIDAFFSELDLPNLRYFHLKVSYPSIDMNDDHYKEVLDKLLNAISTRAPRLEILRLAPFNKEISDCRQKEMISLFIHYCKRLKYLRFIVDDSGILMDEETEKLFVACPFLSWITISPVSALFYNRLTEKLHFFWFFEDLHYKHYIDFS